MKLKVWKRSEMTGATDKRQIMAVFCRFLTYSGNLQGENQSMPSMLGVHD